MEIVFVDDGSVDRTLSILKYHTSKMNIQSMIFHHKWRGLGFSRNLVVNSASGKYIIWVDGDMVLTRDFVGKQVEFMETHPLVGIGKGKYGLHFEGKLARDLQNLEFLTVNFRNEKNSSLPLGTGGAVYRLEAIKHIGGFDENITGAGEDVDAEHRIKTAGWSLSMTPAVFYERYRDTWKDLWQEYFWQGEGGARLLMKKSAINPQMFWLPALFLRITDRAITAYKLTVNVKAFLLPLLYVFKRTAWILGFFAAYSKIFKKPKSLLNRF